MAISKAMLAALQAISQSADGLEVKKTYRLERVLEQTAAKFAPALKTVDYIIKRAGHDVRLRIYPPQNRRDDRILFFFHGGGWVHETIDTYNKVCQRLANQTGWRVASVDYKLAPEFPFPTALEDCYAIVKRFAENSMWLGSKNAEICLIGDSAGGNLAAALSLMARDRGEFHVTRQVLIYPATGSDHFESSPFPSVHENGEQYLLTAKRVREYISLYSGGRLEVYSHPYFAPLYAADKTHQPKTLLITAEFDPLRDEGEAYAVQLRQAGNTVVLYRMADALHGYFSLSMRFEQVRETYRLIDDFLNGEKLYESIQTE